MVERCVVVAHNSMADHVLSTSSQAHEYVPGRNDLRASLVTDLLSSLFEGAYPSNALLAKTSLRYSFNLFGTWSYGSFCFWPARDWPEKNPVRYSIIFLLVGITLFDPHIWSFQSQTSLSYNICTKFRVRDCGCNGWLCVLVGSSASSELSTVDMSSSSEDTPDNDST